MNLRRRDFVKAVAYLGARMSPFGFLLNCATMSTVMTPARKDLGDLLDGFRLYNGNNPSIPYHQEFTYYSKMHCGNSLGERNPGPAWDVLGRPIYACADGIVLRIRTNIEGHGGDAVIVRQKDSPYIIKYEHVSKPKGGYCDRVIRGKTVVARGVGYFKLMPKRGDFGFEQKYPGKTW